MLDLTSNASFMNLLACVALNPALRSMLVFDATYDDLQQISDLLMQLLEIVEAHEKQIICQYNFHSFVMDDDVWGSLMLPGGIQKNALFSLERNAQELQILTIADLTLLNQVTSRTCIALIGSEVVHLERNSQHQCWHPNQFWIASCPHDAVGIVSPHLLDRFALRLNWESLSVRETDDHARRILDVQENVPQFVSNNRIAVPNQYIELVKAAIGWRVEMTLEACTRVLDYMPLGHCYPRRDISLARLALSLAQLEASPQVTTSHVDRAALMLGFSEKKEEPTLKDQPEPEMLEQPTVSVLAEVMVRTELEKNAEIPQRVVASEMVPVAPFTVQPLCHEPYPEDNALIERDVASLKLPFTRYTTGHLSRGPVIGVEETNTLYDLAIVSTIQAAAKHPRKPAHEGQQHKISFRLDDLRRYRRGVIAEYMLMLLIDYTSIYEKVYWHEALIPHLRSAYKQRASVTIIKVGEKQGSFTEELRAQIISAQNILAPRIGIALEANHGRATPLAHGLSLALERLHHVLQHGRSTISKVKFIVISDGRGNIPLEVSQRKDWNKIVTREGIEDALHVARKINGLKRVETVVLDPQPQYYSKLPETLAKALGATIEVIELSDRQEEVEA